MHAAIATKVISRNSRERYVGYWCLLRTSGAVSSPHGSRHNSTAGFDDFSFGKFCRRDCRMPTFPGSLLGSGPIMSSGDNVAVGRRRHGKARISMTGRSPPSGRVPSVRDCFQISGKSEPRTVELLYSLSGWAPCSRSHLLSSSERSRLCCTSSSDHVREQRRGGYSCLIALAACQFLTTP